MKVLVIFPDNISKPMGGLGVQFKNLYSRLNTKVDFYIVGGPEDGEVINNYLEVINPIPQIQGSPLTLVGHTIYLAEALKHPKPDIVHTYDWSTYLAGYYLAKHYNVPLLASMQLSIKGLNKSGIFQCEDPRSVDGQMLNHAHYNQERFVLSQADKIINVSKGYAKYTEEFKDKTIIIPNGINLSDWVRKEKVSLPGKNKHKIVYIGRFAVMKSIDILTQAKIPKEIDLIFVGAPEFGEHYLNEDIANMIDNNENVYFVGPYYNQNKIDLLFEADAVVIPSKHEPFGIVALEALASKSILLSSRVDGMGDFLDDSNSIKVELTVEGIEKAFQDYLTLTEEQKQSMIKNGLETCKKYNWDDIADQYYEVYKSMI